MSRRLAQMKSEDKIIQQERIRIETSVGTVNSFSKNSYSKSFILFLFSSLPLSISMKWLVAVMQTGKFFLTSFF